MRRERPSACGQILAVVSFLNKYKSESGTCVLISKSDLVDFLRKLYKGQICFYMIGSNCGRSGEYDPYACDIDVSADLVGTIRRKYSRVLLVCDGESDMRQMQLLHTVSPYMALLQIQPPYPLHIVGKLYFPVFCMSLECGLVYVECSADSRVLRLDHVLLQSELFAYQLLTRGVGAAAYDQLIMDRILNKREIAMLDSFLNKK